MIPTFGILALSLSALAAASSPLPPAGTTNTRAATDDLIEMARYQVDSERDTTIHYFPDHDVVMEEDTDLSGTWIVDTFEIKEYTTVVAPSDLTIIARRLINVQGSILGAHRVDGGASIVLRSFGHMVLDGVVEAGSSVFSPDQGYRQTAQGGSLWLASRTGIVRGDLHAGRGADALQGFHGGHGGHAMMVGYFFAEREHPGSGLVAGHGGRGGDGSSEGLTIDGGNGGNGGHAMVSVDVSMARLARLEVPNAVLFRSFARVRSLCSPVARARAAFPAFSNVLAMPIVPYEGDADPQSSDCDANQGESGEDQEAADSEEGGPPPSKPEPLTACCQPGVDATVVGVDATAGDGEDGGIGQDATVDPGRGGHGGNGGSGGDATGGIGQGGGDASRCCPDRIDRDCQDSHSSRGGNGEDGGAGNGGSAGNGGVKGNALGDCADGQDGEGGAGGGDFGGDAGWAGDTGSSRSGDLKAPGLPGQPGTPGGSNSGSGGLPGLNGWKGNPDRTITLPPEIGWAADYVNGWARAYGPGSSVRGAEGEPGYLTGSRCN